MRSWQAGGWRAAAIAGAAAALAAAPFSASAAEHATTGPVTVEWIAPAGCPDVGRVRGEIERLLRRPLAGASPEPLRVRAKVGRDGRGLWRMRLETHRSAGTGERTLEGDTCEGVAAATALIIALAIDPALLVATAADAPDGATGAAAPAPAPDPVSAEAAAVALSGAAAAATGTDAHRSDGAARAGAPATDPPAAERTPERDAAAREAKARARIRRATALAAAKGDMELTGVTRPASTGPRLILRTVTAGDLAALPGATAGFGLAAGVLVAPFRLEVAGVFWVPRAAPAPGVAGPSPKVGLETGALRGCFSPSVERVFETPLCLGLEVGRMHARVVESGQFLWLAATASAGIAWIPLKWLAIQLQADVVIPFVRSPLTYGMDSTVLHEPAPVSVRSLLGVEVRFF